MVNFYLGLAIALSSVLWVELVRDIYHVLSHLLPPLYRLHVWHHKVFRRDLSTVSNAIYRQAHWYNDVPESLVMLVFSLLFWFLASNFNFSTPWLAGTGTIYTLTFLFGAIARGTGIPYADELTDFTHLPGDFKSLPATWFINRPYHWRHHFDNQNAYFCGTISLVDKLMGTALSLKGKKIAVTGASGSLGKALLEQLHLKGAKVTALTSSQSSLILEVKGKELPIKTLTWEVGKETELATELENMIDVSN